VLRLATNLWPQIFGLATNLATNLYPGALWPQISGLLFGTWPRETLSQQVYLDLTTNNP
jgi:hypothetical protein